MESEQLECGVAKNELEQTIDNLVNELDIAFDYIDKTTIDKLKRFRSKLNDEAFLKQFVTEIYEYLKQFETNISYIVMSKQKLKTSDYEFLNNVKLFDNILEFSVFDNENKNTKRTLVNYLYNMYMSSFILQFGLGLVLEGENDFAKNLSNFVENLKQQVETPKEPKQSKQPRQPRRTNTNNQNNPGQLPAGFDNVFASLMSNKEIMNIATDLSKDIKEQNIDPMSLLTSMMSGKPNNQLQSLVTNISNKLEDKIQKGDIDKDLLEQQAQNILNTVNTSDILSNLNLSDLG